MREKRIDFPYIDLNDETRRKPKGDLLVFAVGGSQCDLAPGGEILRFAQDDRGRG